MPCMTLTGHPCAGKTTLAHIIKERTIKRSSKIKNVVIINEQSACPDHTISECYETAASEKKTRGALKSAFDRAVSAHKDDTLIILDSTNYIKGFRYEIFCIAKAAGSTHCVVWCLNDVKVAKEWNRKRPESYSDEQLEALVLRYEPPDNRNRWDKPLYKIDLRPKLEQQSELAGDVLDRSVYNMHNLSDAIGSMLTSTDEPETKDTPTTDNADLPKKTTTTTFKRAAFNRPNKAAITVQSQVPSAKKTATLTAEALTLLEQSHAEPAITSHPAEQKQELTSKQKPATPRSIEEQVDEILDSFLQNVKPLAEGTSTRQHVASDANVLHNVDAITQQVLSSVTAAQNKSATGIGRLPVGDGLYLECHRKLQPPELRRYRRQYIQWVVTHPPEDPSETGIAKSFLAYIETQR